jgi:ABC-2 type transport system ATP-binding protein
MDRPIVRVAGVSRKFGAVRALDAVSFQVAAGEMFGIIGPDGAGKTTSIRLICGLLAADAGEIRVMDRDPARDHDAITTSVGYFSQRFSLYGDLSVDENIAFFAEIHGVADYRSRRDRLLDMTQLAPFRRRRADRLSGGMKQKLALACTLVHEPRLVLLDEPTTGVDPVSRREFWKLLAEFRSQGITILMTTPYLDEAERCSRVMLLHEGRVLAVDTPNALRAMLPEALVEVLAEPHRKALEVVRSLPAVGSAESFGERLHVRFAAGAAPESLDGLSSELTRAGVTVSSVRRVPASLEDVFIELIRT